jgi:hypothetical protein
MGEASERGRRKIVNEKDGKDAGRSIGEES